MHVIVSQTTRRLVAALFLAAALSPAAAVVEPDTLQQRKLFQNAEQALKQGQLDEYRTLASQLQDYPLYPYLRFAEIQRELGRADNKTIHRFLQEHTGTPLSLIHI